MATRTTPHIVVQARREFWGAILFWVVWWALTAAAVPSTFRESVHGLSSPDVWLRELLLIALLILGVVLGPVWAARYSHRLEVEGDDLLLTKYCGRVVCRYRRADIRASKFSAKRFRSLAGPKASLQLLFEDGRRLLVDSNYSEFDNLCSYCARTGE